MFDVNIYIETSINQVKAAKTAAGMYVLECVGDSRVLGTRDELIYEENITEYALNLKLLYAAFYRITKCSSVKVNTKCEKVFGAIKNQWYRQWEKNGWTTAKGSSPKNQEIWEPLVEKMKLHLVTADHWKNSYENLMQNAIRKELQVWHESSIKKKDILKIREVNHEEI